MFLKARLNQTTMLRGVMAPPFMPDFDLAIRVPVLRRYLRSFALFGRSDCRMHSPSKAQLKFSGRKQTSFEPPSRTRRAASDKSLEIR